MKNSLKKAGKLAQNEQGGATLLSVLFVGFAVLGIGLYTNLESDAAYVSAANVSNENMAKTAAQAGINGYTQYLQSQYASSPALVAADPVGQAAQTTLQNAHPYLNASATTTITANTLNAGVAPLPATGYIALKAVGISGNQRQTETAVLAVKAGATTTTTPPPPVLSITAPGAATGISTGMIAVTSAANNSSLSFNTTDLSIGTHGYVPSNDLQGVGTVTNTGSITYSNPSPDMSTPLSLYAGQDITIESSGDFDNVEAGAALSVPYGFINAPMQFAYSGSGGSTFNEAGGAVKSAQSTGNISINTQYSPSISTPTTFGTVSANGTVTDQDNAANPPSQGTPPNPYPATTVNAGGNVSFYASVQNGETGGTLSANTQNGPIYLGGQYLDSFLYDSTVNYGTYSVSTGYSPDVQTPAAVATLQAAQTQPALSAVTAGANANFIVQFEPVTIQDGYSMPSGQSGTENDTCQPAPTPTTVAKVYVPTVTVSDISNIPNGLYYLDVYRQGPELMEGGACTVQGQEAIAPWGSFTAFYPYTQMPNTEDTIFAGNGVLSDMGGPTNGANEGFDVHKLSNGILDPAYDGQRAAQQNDTTGTVYSSGNVTWPTDGVVKICNEPPKISTWLDMTPGSDTNPALYMPNSAKCYAIAAPGTPAPHEGWPSSSNWPGYYTGGYFGLSPVPHIISGSDTSTGGYNVYPTYIAGASHTNAPSNFSEVIPGIWYFPAMPLDMAEYSAQGGLYDTLVNDDNGSVNIENSLLLQGVFTGTFIAGNGMYANMASITAPNYSAAATCDNSNPALQGSYPTNFCASQGSFISGSLPALGNDAAYIGGNNAPLASSTLFYSGPDYFYGNVVSEGPLSSIPSGSSSEPGFNDRNTYSTIIVHGKLLSEGSMAAVSDTGIISYQSGGSGCADNDCFPNYYNDRANIPQNMVLNDANLPTTLNPNSGGIAGAGGTSGTSGTSGTLYTLQPISNFYG